MNSDEEMEYLRKELKTALQKIEILEGEIEVLSKHMIDVNEWVSNKTSETVTDLDDLGNPFYVEVNK